MNYIDLTCKPILNGIMVYWDGVETAARYIITLYINDNDISTRINERTEKYCAFTGLAAIDGVTSSSTAKLRNACQTVVGGGSYVPRHSGLDYYVCVQAEDRTGNIIAKSNKVKCSVKEL